jgi:nucleotide-binding universal stress UspA family protein
MYHKILVPLDGSRVAESALPHAVNLAATNKAEVVLMGVTVPPQVFVVDDEDVELAREVQQDIKQAKAADTERMRSYLTRQVGKLKSENVNACSVVTEGSAANSIVDFARDNGVDVIVMSTHGRSGVQRWLLGSVADRVVHAATVPVMLVRAAGA